MAGTPLKHIKDKAQNRMKQMGVQAPYSLYCYTCRSNMNSDYYVEFCPNCGGERLTLNDHAKLETKFFPMDKKI